MGPRLKSLWVVGVTGLLALFPTALMARDLASFHSFNLIAEEPDEALPTRPRRTPPRTRRHDVNEGERRDAPRRSYEDRSRAQLPGVNYDSTEVQETTSLPRDNSWMIFGHGLVPLSAKVEKLSPFLGIGASWWRESGKESLARIGVDLILDVGRATDRTTYTDAITGAKRTAEATATDLLFSANCMVHLLFQKETPAQTPYASLGVGFVGEYVQYTYDNPITNRSESVNDSGLAVSFIGRIGYRMLPGVNVFGGLLGFAGSANTTFALELGLGYTW